MSKKIQSFWEPIRGNHPRKHAQGSSQMVFCQPNDVNVIPTHLSAPFTYNHSQMWKVPSVHWKNSKITFPVYIILKMLTGPK